MICRFLGCDDDATTTVGVTPLCALHRDHVIDMLDHENQPGANLELGVFMEEWLMTETRRDTRKLRS